MSMRIINEIIPQFQDPSVRVNVRNIPKNDMIKVSNKQIPRIKEINTVFLLEESCVTCFASIKFQ